MQGNGLEGVSFPVSKRGDSFLSRTREPGRNPWNGSKSWYEKPAPPSRQFEIPEGTFWNFAKAVVTGLVVAFTLNSFFSSMPGGILSMLFFIVISALAAFQRLSVRLALVLLVSAAVAGAFKASMVGALFSTIFYGFASVLVSIQLVPLLVIPTILMSRCGCELNIERGKVDVGIGGIYGILAALLFASRTGPYDTLSLSFLIGGLAGGLAFWHFSGYPGDRWGVANRIASLFGKRS